jgi:hypothetical protein
MTNALPWIALLAIGLPVLILLALVWRRLPEGGSGDAQAVLTQQLEGLGQRLEDMSN